MCLLGGVAVHVSLDCFDQQIEMSNNGMHTVFHLYVCVHVSQDPYDMQKPCGRRGR